MLADHRSLKPCWAKHHDAMWFTYRSNDACTAEIFCPFHPLQVPAKEAKDSGGRP